RREPAAAPDLDLLPALAFVARPAARDARLPRLEHELGRLAGREHEADRARPLLLAVAAWVRAHRVGRLDREHDLARRKRGGRRDLPEAAQPRRRQIDLLLAIVAAALDLDL